MHASVTLHLSGTVGIFSQIYTTLLLFISCFSTYAAWISTILYSIFSFLAILYSTCDCSIRVTIVDSSLSKCMVTKVFLEEEKLLITRYQRHDHCV